MNWIKTSDSLPDGGERVLVYWLELGDLHQAHVCEYFRKGDVVSDEVVPIGDSPVARLLDAVFGKRGERTIEQDGFYIYDSVDDTAYWFTDVCGTIAYRSKPKEEVCGL